MSRTWGAVPGGATCLPDEPRTPSDVRDLGTRQAELIAALVAGAACPAGFDHDRLIATRRSLLRKRAGAAAKAWPLLAASLGADWRPTFVRLRDGHPPVGSLRDGWDVAVMVREKEALTPSAAGELADREAVLRYDGTGEPRRRLLSRARRSAATMARRLGHRH